MCVSSLWLADYHAKYYSSTLCCDLNNEIKMLCCPSPYNKRLISFDTAGRLVLNSYSAPNLLHGLHYCNYWYHQLYVLLNLYCKVNKYQNTSAIFSELYLIHSCIALLYRSCVLRHTYCSLEGNIFLFSWFLKCFI